MIKTSTIQLLRFPFSFFLAPVSLFALSELEKLHPQRTLLVLVILHLLVYPASNGYNSYMDRDVSSIGGVEKPLQPTRQLYYIAGLMDLLAILSGLLVSPIFAGGILIYILVSRAYSYRGIRLKKYPLTGFLSVVIFQGAWTFALVYHGAGHQPISAIPLLPMGIASLLIAGSYPLTQIYQHASDQQDGVHSISMKLGIRGTFLFSGSLFVLAVIGLMIHYTTASGRSDDLFRLLIGLMPVFVWFNLWALRTWKNPDAANFRNTMRMNLLASFCTSTVFLLNLLN